MLTATRYSIESIPRGMAQTNSGREQKVLHKYHQSRAQDEMEDLPEDIRVMRRSRDRRLRSNVTNNTTQSDVVKTSKGSAAPVYSFEDWANTLDPVPQKPKFQGWQSKKDRQKEEEAGRAAAELLAREGAEATRDAAERAEDLRHEAALNARDEEEVKAKQLRNEMRGIQVPLEQSCTGVNWDIGSDRMDNLKFKSFDDVLAKKRKIVGGRGATVPSVATSGRGAASAASLRTSFDYLDDDEEMFVSQDPSSKIDMSETFLKTGTMCKTAGASRAKAGPSSKRATKPTSSSDFDTAPFLSDEAHVSHIPTASTARSRLASQPSLADTSDDLATYLTRHERATRKRKRDTQPNEKAS